MKNVLISKFIGSAVGELGVWDGLSSVATVGFHWIVWRESTRVEVEHLFMGINGCISCLPPLSLAAQVDDGFQAHQSS